MAGSDGGRLSESACLSESDDVNKSKHISKFKNGGHDEKFGQRVSIG